MENKAIFLWQKNERIIVGVLPQLVMPGLSTRMSSFPQKLKVLFMLKRSSLFLVLATAAIPAYSQVFGSLANFDVVNDTNKTAHGFEIDIHDIHSSDITSIFGAANRWPNMERYGAPTVTEYSDATGFGVKITYKAAYNGAWAVGTPSGTLPVSPSDSCWPLGAPTYGPLYPCDHFGVSTSISTPKVSYAWLVESTPNSSVLTPVVATVPNPVWTVTPVPPIANVPQPPKVNVAIVAPAPNAYEFGEPRWVKVTAIGTLKDVAVEDLVAENQVIKNTQTQIEWQLIQVDAGKLGSGQIDLTGVALDPGATGVVYRFEFYKYTGDRDPQTNEALPLTSDTPAQPDIKDLGEFLVAQNAGINFDGKIPAAPPLPIAPSINATINGAVVGSPYSQVIKATPGNANDVLALTVTGLPAGLSFNPLTNTISGVASVVGNFPLIINVKDITNNTSASASTQIDVADAPIVFNLTLDQGTVGNPYSKQVSATGGYGAITYSVSGNLPAGLALTGDTITGTPTIAGSSLVTLQAKDTLNYSQVASATLSVVNGAAACKDTNKVISGVNKFWLDIAGGLANGGQSVNYAPQANTTFTPPLTVGVFKAGQLVSYTGTVDAQNFCVASTMTVAPGLSLNTITLAKGTLGVAYPAVAVTPVGGVSPYTIAVTGLPTGLSFNGTSIIGTPTQFGTFTVMASVSDANGQNVFSNLTLTVDPAPVAISGTLPNGQVASAYSASLKATGGNGALAWTLSGAIPGVNFANGVFSGTPTTVGTYTLTIMAADNSGHSASAPYTVAIANSAACTKPNTAKAFTVARSKITAVTATTITVGGKVVKTGCASVVWNGATAFKVGGYAAVNTGFTVSTTNTALKITMN
jgi:Putative Ig domain